MSENSNRLDTALTALAVIIAIGVHWLHSPWLIYIFKPLATILILRIALVNRRRGRQAYALWITIGLLFSLLGDIVLLWPERYFLAGLAAFLLTHVAYLVAFTRDAEFPARPLVWFLYLAVGAGLFLFLKPSLPAGLRIPVALYAAVLATMAGQAMGRALVLQITVARFAAVGALLFLCSDALLSIDRFHSPIPLAPLLILANYYAGQWFIARSTDL